MTAPTAPALITDHRYQHDRRDPFDRNVCVRATGTLGAVICGRPLLEHEADAREEEERRGRLHLATLDRLYDKATDPAVDEAARARALRGGLREALALLEHPARITGPAVRRLRQLAEVDPAAPASAWDRALDGMTRAGARWTEEEVARVDAAIRACAARLEEFTADDVWAELGDGFLVTKGLAGRLLAAVNADVIASTGMTRTSERDGQHGHGQRLTVWRPA